jgi:methyl-accepting chemotaxis protein
MSAFRRLTIAWKLILVAGLAIGLLLIAAAAAVSSHTSAIVSGLTNQYAGAVADEAIEEVQADIGRVQSTARSMAVSIGAAHEAGLRDRPTVVGMLKPNAESSEFVLGSWFIALPNSFDGKDAEMVGQTALGANSKGAFSPYWVHDGGRVIFQPLDSSDDYAQPYFAVAQKTGKGAIVEPYPYDIAGKSVLMTSVAYPVTSQGTFIGVAGLDMALDEVSKSLGALKPLGGGRVMLLSAQGKWVSHPQAAKRMTAYADAGADKVAEVLQGGAPAQIEGVIADGVPMARIVRAVPMPALNTTWALVMDVPVAAITAGPGHVEKLAEGDLISRLREDAFPPRPARSPATSTPPSTACSRPWPASWARPAASAPAAARSRPPPTTWPSAPSARPRAWSAPPPPSTRSPPP